MSELEKKIVNNLATIKSIVTLSATAVFVILSLTHVITSDQVMMIYTAIIAFYFGTQTEKKASEKK